jgi:hypothetical protein
MAMARHLIVKYIARARSGNVPKNETRKAPRLVDWTPSRAILFNQSRARPALLLLCRQVAAGDLAPPGPEMDFPLVCVYRSHRYDIDA